MSALLDKLKKLSNGELSTHTLTKAEGDELLKILADNGKAEETRKALGLDSIEEMTSLMPALLQSASNGENYLTRLERKVGRGELTEKLSGAFNTLMNLTQIGVASSQINKSNKALGALSAPGQPGIPQEDPALSNAIYEAGRGTFDATRAASPAMRQIRNNRMSDEAVARQVGGGQAGIYGALNQAASLRANRAYSELTPMIDSIRAREQSRLDNLLATRQQARQSDFQNRMNLYDVANQNYRAEMQTAGELGQAGRENLYGGLAGLADSLAVAGGGLYGKQFTPPNFKRRIATKTGVPELDTFNSKADQYLINSRKMLDPVVPEPDLMQQGGNRDFTNYRFNEFLPSTHGLRASGQPLYPKYNNPNLMDYYTQYGSGPIYDNR